jgi:hypothetical protein
MHAFADYYQNQKACASQVSELEKTMYAERITQALPPYSLWTLL